MTQSNYRPATATTTDVTTVEVRAGDRIRWGAIMAGLFAALSTLVVLGVLGAAIGLSAYDRGDDARRFGIGASIWGAISMIVAFIVGGYVAGRYGAPFGRDRGAVVHGAMVWAVAIPLSLLILGGVGTMLGSGAASGALANRDLTSQMSGGGGGGGDRFDAARPAGAELGANVGERTGDDAAERARRRSAGAAWGTLISLLLGLGAAALGGRLGATGDRDADYGRTRGATADTADAGRASY